MQRFKSKPSSRSTFRSNLANSRWVTSPDKLSTRALAISYCVAYFTRPVLSCSRHDEKTESVHNESCRRIIGWLHPTKVVILCCLSGIPHPVIRRTVTNRLECKRQNLDPPQRTFGDFQLGLGLSSHPVPHSRRMLRQRNGIHNICFMGRALRVTNTNAKR